MAGKSYLCQIKDCSGKVIYSFEGPGGGASPIGGTFANPDFINWHRGSVWQCEKLRMVCTVKRACPTDCTLPPRTMVSDLVLNIGDYRIIDCNGDCVELLCA